jgi:hypothetical protein
LLVVSRNHRIWGLAMRQGIGTQPDASAAWPEAGHPRRCLLSASIRTLLGLA